MEKQRIKRICKLGKRLLISAILLAAFPVFAQSSTATKSNQKLIPLEDQKLYPKQDIKYEILFPKTKSTNVLLQSQNLPSGIELRTVRKSEYYTEEGGTLLELWYRFDKKGKYTIPQLTIMVNNKRKFFSFEKIVIEEDPANMMPKIVLQFENGVSLSSEDMPSSKPLFDAIMGQKVKFKINLQYTTQLVHFSWEIPQDSIFTQTKTYEITEIKYREKNYSNELIPVADFEWTVLSKGAVALPKIKLVATAYKGYRTELSLPESFINFKEKANLQETPEEDEKALAMDKLFDDAFNKSYKQTLEEEKILITEEYCETLAQMHSRERNIPFINQKEIQERKQLEEMLGLPSDSAEFNLCGLYLFGTLVLFFTALVILFFKLKKNIAGIIASVFLVCAIVLCSYSCAKLSKRYAISKGCILYSIPETTANSTSEIGPGNRVTIVEKAGNWYFVELGTISGWCTSDAIIPIK